MAGHHYYNKINFPRFVCNNGNWDIYCNDAGYCASIPTDKAAKIGCLATHFGDTKYARVTLGVTVDLKGGKTNAGIVQ